MTVRLIKLTECIFFTRLVIPLTIHLAGILAKSRTRKMGLIYPINEGDFSYSQHQNNSDTMESKQLEKLRPSSADAVNRRVTKGPVTYCQQITKEEYEKQAVDFSRQQIRNLLRSIVDDRSLPCKEVTKRLAQVWRNIHL